MTPVTQSLSTGGTSKAPTVMSEPRGSFATAERKGSNCRRNRSRLSAKGPVPRSGPPEMTVRVGSPPVWESMTLMHRFIFLYANDGAGSVEDGQLSWLGTNRVFVMRFLSNPA